VFKHLKTCRTQHT